MEDVASTLEILLNRATDVRNSATDTSAALEFCSVVNKEPCCAHIAARVIANRIQSPEEWEALQGLNLIDTCMKHCGAIFHAEVGKFRFLNEMIKLVSPKYLGSRTAPAVRRRVLQLMHTWTVDYPRETKIREAYDMLKKQGVIKEEASYSSSLFNNCSGSSLPPPPPRRSTNTIFEDEERSRLLQKLLQSKNPDDLQAANRLIKTMVKEDERRVEINSRRITELESVHNNARLLSEMLDSYRPGQSSQEELELIKELHQSCERLRPNVFQLASETQDNEAMLNEVLSASDELGQVFDKYTAVIVQGKMAYIAPKSSTTSLLDLSTPSEEKLPPVPIELLENQLSDLGFNISMQQDNKSNSSKGVALTSNKQSNLEDLGDIFATIEPVKGAPTSPVHSILQPTTVQQTNTKSVSLNPHEVPEKNSKLKALEDLDALGETMLKQSLPTSCKLGSQFVKPSGKVPMNLLGLGKPPVSELLGASNTPHGMGDASVSPSVKPVSSFDLDFLIGGAMKVVSGVSISDLLNGDDSMVDLSEEGGEVCTEVAVGDSRKDSSVPQNQSNNVVESPSVQQIKNSLSPEHVEKKSVQDPKSTSNSSINDMQNKSIANTPVKKIEVQPLTDISVTLDSIKPGSLPPYTAMEERNGISVILHFANDTPRPDVSVIVVTTVSKNTSALTNYLFQAVVPKTCKLRLLPPSTTELSAHSPFLPPSAITQVMLIANPNKDPVSLKFILSYMIDNETVTEMGEVEQLPLVT